MDKYIATKFTCTGFIIMALSGIGKILMIGLPDFYVHQEDSSIIPLLTFIGGSIVSLIGISFYIKKVYNFLNSYYDIF
ncbi:hypothetical protein [Aquisalibacillus elongatus]|uniref:Uncharacterized protein n=1 Tax=Aquisalibacillus elongatus TaxID=485577 RepID=A0A3N5BDE2_9BACI|nr:hypothetical protein [Aquisalibacillus elongatus]RPF55493.1 hypothetical protein EDC24_0371 [Aquisalibacillus elongatus]